MTDAPIVTDKMEEKERHSKLLDVHFSNIHPPSCQFSCSLRSFYIAIDRMRENDSFYIIVVEKKHLKCFTILIVIYLLDRYRLVEIQRQESCEQDYYLEFELRFSSDKLMYKKFCQQYNQRINQDQV